MNSSIRGDNCIHKEWCKRKSPNFVFPEKTVCNKMYHISGCRYSTETCNTAIKREFYTENAEKHTACTPEIDTWPRNMLLSKNPQFLPNCFETWSK